MSHLRLILLFCAAGLSTACCRNSQDIPEPEPQVEYESVPLHSTISTTKPMTGIVVWTESSAVKKPWVALEFSYMLYNTVCSEKDVYDWTPMDRLLEEVASRGHQAVVRFRYTYPGYASSVPDYIKQLPDYEARWASAEGRRTEYPDWRCEELQRFHKEFHRRFAERYDNDPRLAFLETGFGHWAEYHVYDGLYIKGHTFPSHDFQSEFLPLMDEWFVHTPWLISIDAADSKYAPFHKQKELLELDFGNFDDSFMCEDHDDYNRECWQFFGSERYKRAPLGGEFSYYSNYDQKHALDKGGMYGRVFEDEVAAFHMTFIIGNDQPGKQTDERIQEACLSMGYHYVIKEFAVKSGEAAQVLIANEGVAPIYRDAFVAVDGVRAEASLRDLMPGEEREIIIATPSASASSILRIESDSLLPGATVPFEADIE